jgi:rubrerythrin
MDDVTAASCVELAVRIEEIGAELYQALARKFSGDRELGDLFAGLGRDEAQHRELFRVLHDRARSRPSERAIPVELAQHIRSTSTSGVFSALRDLQGDVDEIRSREDALQRAFEFEKATLAYFEAMHEAFPEDEVLGSLVAVEKSHVAKVMELMVTGARFRGLGDRFST